MLLLGLDTSTLTLSAALVERTAGGERVLAAHSLPPPTPHSSLLPALLDRMLGQVQVRPHQLAAVVVGLGPGSFTGLRIGLAAAKGLCYAAGVPLAGASSLEAMALKASSDAPPGSLLVPCLDARKGEVYCGFYRARGPLRVERVGEEAALKPEALLHRLAAEPGARVFGIGRRAYPALSALPAPEAAGETPEAPFLVAQVREVRAFSKQAVFSLQPHYVRPSEAEWVLKEKSRARRS